MTTTEGSTLRGALDEHTAGRGKRYEAELKSRVVAFAQAQRGQGRSWGQVATELGLRFETLRRWCVKGSSSLPRAMRRVEIVADVASRRLAVVSPGGLRIEGLTLEDAVALLRAVG
jgi:transposase